MALGRLGLIMSMASMILVLLRSYFDDRVHPGMDAALEEMYAFAESFYLYTVTGADHRSDIRSAFWQGRQP
jgi:hypothetical protein